ncbi:hypothetical protein [Chryseobacterium sp.]|uniref:hypothetical protein n=1 Tax=Chryseobacterium sp. TaxID=1871047 RepID=UPI0035C67FDC
MKRIFLSLSICFLFLSCRKEYDVNDFSGNLKPYLERLSKEKAVPVSDTTAKNFLERNASKEELIKLMDAKKPLLRVVAYGAIVNRNEPEYFDLLINHLNDTAKVEWWYYEDAVGYFSVSDLMIRKAFDENGLSPIQKKVLTEEVLLKHPYLDVSNWMIQDIDPDEKYYHLIKERAKTKSKDCGNQLISCYALSKFRKKQDAKLLLSVFKQNINGYCQENIFKSIEIFPDAVFFPLLKSYFQDNIKDKLSEKKNLDNNVLYFVKAVAAYKNSEAFEILNYIAQNNTYINKGFWPPANKTDVLKALKIHYTPAYDPLIKEIEKEMNPCDLQSLISEIGFEIRGDDRQKW